MSDIARRIIMDRRSREDYARGDRRRGMDRAMRGGFEGKFGGQYDGRSRDYNDYEYDERRGGRRDRTRDDYAMDDYRSGNYGYDSRDYGEEMRLTKRDMMDWKRDLENADGTMGEHFDLAAIRQTAQAFNLPMRDYDEKELCMTANMLYSDYCEVLKQFIPRDKEVMAYVKLAQAFLEDPDAGLKGGEKLAGYYYTLVCDE